MSLLTKGDIVEHIPTGYTYTFLSWSRHKQAVCCKPEHVGQDRPESTVALDIDDLRCVKVDVGDLTTKSELIERLRGEVVTLNTKLKAAQSELRDLQVEFIAYRESAKKPQEEPISETTRKLWEKQLTGLSNENQELSTGVIKLAEEKGREVAELMSIIAELYVKCRKLEKSNG